MFQDRSQTYWERFLFHKRFYIPAAFCLFLSFPGNLAALLPSFSVPLTVAQRAETLWLNVPVVMAYVSLLIWGLPSTTKMWLGVFGQVIPYLLTLLLLRTTTFTTNFHLAVLRSDVFLHFLPPLFMFLVLCVMDQKRRDKKIFYSLLTLSILLICISVKQIDSVHFLDTLRFADVNDRILASDPVDEGMFEQCHLISDNSMRHKCLLVLNSSTNGGLECEETDAVNDCSLSRGEHARKTLSSHPQPSPQSNPEDNPAVP